MTYLDQNVAGKGVRFGLFSSVFINQASGTTNAGNLHVLAEAITEGPGGLTANSGAELGTLANTVGPPASSGVTGATPSGSLYTFVLVTEAVAQGAPYRGVIEGYYVDATVASGTLVTRSALFPNGTSRNLITPGATLGIPCIARYLGPGATASADNHKVHFRGFPGGFGIGAGAT